MADARVASVAQRVDSGVSDGARGRVTIGRRFALETPSAAIAKWGGRARAGVFLQTSMVLVVIHVIIHGKRTATG